MSDEANLTDFDLESRLLYACVVAGKSAVFTNRVMAQIQCHRRGDEPLFAMVRRLSADGQLCAALKLCRSGNYTKLARCFSELAHAKLNLRTCSPADLERIHGIGPKTSRFFILWTRPGARYAALDVHVLRWMREHGYPAPRSTPSGPLYAALEQSFIHEAEKRGLTARQLDHQIWSAAATGENVA